MDWAFAVFLAVMVTLSYLDEMHTDTQYTQCVTTLSKTHKDLKEVQAICKK